MGTTILITAIITSILDWGIGTIIAYQRKNKQDENDKIFMDTVKSTLKDNTKPLDERFELIQELSRDTEGVVSSTVYQVIDNLKDK